MDNDSLREEEVEVMDRFMVSHAIRMGATVSAMISCLFFPITPPPWNDFEPLFILFCLVMSFSRLNKKESEELEAVRRKHNPYLE